LLWSIRINDASPDAEPVLQRALGILEKQLGPEHSTTAITRDNLAKMYQAQGQHARAMPLYQRALTIHEKAFGPNHPIVARNLENLADTYRAQNQYPQAEVLYQTRSQHFKKSLGNDHVDTAEAMSRLGQLYELQGLYSQAEPLFQQAIAIRKSSRAQRALTLRVNSRIWRDSINRRISWNSPRISINSRWSSTNSPSGMIARPT
jgi:tetratricopeptide (TPR) repeat protein